MLPSPEAAGTLPGRAFHFVDPLPLPSPPNSGSHKNKASSGFPLIPILKW